MICQRLCLVKQIRKGPAGFCGEEDVFATIRTHFEKYHYLCDTHTAVALKVYADYVKSTGDDIVSVIDSTASPYKFSASVLSALQDSTKDMSEFEMVDELHRVSGMDVPQPIEALQNKAVRFREVCSKDEMSEIVFKLLKI